MLKKEKKLLEEYTKRNRMMPYKYFVIVAVILFLSSCHDTSPTLIFENSSKSKSMNLEYSLNGKIIDTINIPPLSKQEYQWSIRKTLVNKDFYSLVFTELNSGKIINKKLKNPNSDFSFFILGNDNLNNEFVLDTSSLNYIPPYQ